MLNGIHVKGLVRLQVHVETSPPARPRPNTACMHRTSAASLFIEQGLSPKRVQTLIRTQLNSNERLRCSGAGRRSGVVRLLETRLLG